MADVRHVIEKIDMFYGGMVRDDHSSIIGCASNIEEVDIFENKDFVRSAQVMSDDTLPATTKSYAKCSGDNDVVYAYGEETVAHKVCLLSVAGGGGSNPSTFSTLATESDTTNLVTLVSDFKFFRSSESSNPTSLYFIKGTSTSWYIARYNIGATAFQRWTGSAWSASGAWDAYSQLTGLNGSFMRPTMKVIYDSLYICHGRFIARVDDDAVFTEKAFTLPNEWEAVDIIPVSDIAWILARNKNRLVNESCIFIWDMVSSNQFNEQIKISMGGPQWFINHKETVKILCAINGKAKMYQMSGAFAGALPIPLPGIELQNVATETSTQPISSPKMLAQKDNILYFNLWKTDKSAIYAIGQLDTDKPNALILAKRFATTAYATHTPYSLWIQGSNFYADFDDNTAGKMSRCETLNTPNRSSQAVYETIWLNSGDPYRNKDLKDVVITAKPLVTGTSLACYVATDYTESYTEIKRRDASVFNTVLGIFAKMFGGNIASGKKAFKVKITWTSSTTNSPFLQSVGLNLAIAPQIAES